jgi:hypothetical protein
MAAFLIYRIFGPNLTPRGSSTFAKLSLSQRRSAHLGASFTRLLVTGSEIVLFVWMIAVLAFSLLIICCFFL